jgi:hypothetical protein
MTATVQKVELYEIPLLKGLGYFYAKVLHFYVEEFEDITLMVRVYDSYHTDSIYKTKKQIDKSIFESDDYYTYPLLIWNKPRKKGKYKWYFIEELRICKFDKVTPDFAILSIDKEEGKAATEEQTSVIKNFGNKAYIYPYKNVQHLGRWYHSGDVYIQLYVTLLFLIKKDFSEELIKHPRKDFSDALRKKVVNANFSFDEYNDLAFRITFNDIKRRRDYQTIPKEIRDKAIEDE